MYCRSSYSNHSPNRRSPFYFYFFIFFYFFSACSRSEFPLHSPVLPLHSPARPRLSNRHGADARQWWGRAHQGGGGHHLPDPKPAIETSQPLLHAERAVWQRVQDAVCLLHQIFSLLSPSDLGRATAVCRDWRAAGQNDELWSRYFDTQLGLAAKLKSRQPLQTWFQLYSQNKLAQLQLHSCPPDTGIGKAPARDGFLLGIEICRGRQQGNTTLFSSVQEIDWYNRACITRDRLIQLQDIKLFEPGALSFDNVLVTVLLIRKVDGKIVTLLDPADGEGDDFSDNDDELRWSISSYVSIPDSRPKDPLTRDLLPASHSACAEFDTALLIERVPRCNCAGAYDVEEPMCVPEFSSRSVLLYLAMYALKMIRVRS